MRLLLSLFIVIPVLYPNFAFSDGLGSRELCRLSGTIRLTAPAELYCMKDLVVEDGTQIITQGYRFNLMVIGSISYGEERVKKATRLKRNSIIKRGLSIRSFPERTLPGKPGGPIIIYANLVSGYLDIRNLGSSGADPDGSITLEYMGIKPGYDHDIVVQDKTKVNVLIGGYSAPLHGPNLKLESSH